MEAVIIQKQLFEYESNRKYHYIVFRSEKHLIRKSFTILFVLQTLLLRILQKHY
jgi:hypothetical protein